MAYLHVSDTAPRRVYSVGASPRQSFAVPFAIPAAASLRVLINGTLASLSSNPTTAVEYSFAGTAGDGGYPSGTITLGAAITNATVIVSRALAVERITEFEFPSRTLNIRALNGEFNNVVMIVQQMMLEAQRSIRLGEDDTSDLGLLPAERAGKIIGFDSLGRIQLRGEDASNYEAPYSGAVPLTVAERIGEKLTALDFGAVGDGTDVTAELQAACAAAAASGRLLEIGDGTYRITSTLTLPGGAAGLIMRGRILYDGVGGEPALVIGDAGAVRNGEKLYWGLRVVRSVQSDWTDEADIGIVLRNLDASFVEVRQVEGFTIGVRTLGDQRGFEDTTINLGRLADNRIGLDIRTGAATGWNNSIRYIGGHFGVSSGLHTGLDRFGVRFSAEPGAYLNHNGHMFEAPNFELARPGGGVAAIPFLSEVNSRAVVARAVRMEACDAFIARHTAGAQDHVYEAAYTGTWAYDIDIDYTATATRVGSVVQTMHQSAAHTRFTHLLASTPSVRAAAFRWSASQIGFDGLSCIAASPSGPPNTIDGLAFPGLDGYTPYAGFVSLAAGRGLAYAVHASGCRDFALAVDADAARLFVQCYNVAGNILTSGDLVRLSSGSVTYNVTSRWWQAAADLSDDSLTRLTAIRLDPSVAFAHIGVFANGSECAVRAMRLYCPPEFSPLVINGTPLVPAGRGWIEVDHAFNPPNISAGQSAQESVSITEAYPGDICSAAWSAASSGVLFLPHISATGTVTLTMWNRTGSSVDLPAGSARVRVQKQRII